jgi:tetratricopeptide (TPR) repeat protein
MPMPNPDRLLQDGIALHRAGRVEDAVRVYKKVLRKHPGAASALNLLGLAEFQLGHLPEAADALAKACRLDPALPNIDYNLGRVLQAQGRLEQALTHYQKAVARAPQDAEAISNLGTVLSALGRFEEAVPTFVRATDLSPRASDIWHNLGNALAALDRHDEALTAFQRELELRPGHVPALGSLANAYSIKGRDDEALAAYDRAIALDPDAHEARWNKGLLLLSRGRFAEGWPFYESRWKFPEAAPKARAFSQPCWNGAYVQGALLAWAEQGIGDQILMSGMIADLLGRADQVFLEVDSRLVPLLQRSLPKAAVVPAGQELPPAISAQSALGDLARYLRPDADSFNPSAGGYLTIDGGRAADFRRRLQQGDERIIGLSWVSANRKLGHSKSASLRDFLPLLRLPGCRFVDLQYGDTREERERLARETGIVIEHLPDLDLTYDLDGLASLIAACDAVVTVSNTTAHVAAAQGRKTFVMLSDASGLLWYWMKRGDSTPIYASARLFRRLAQQPWTELAAQEVAPELVRYLASLPKADR